MRGQVLLTNLDPTGLGGKREKEIEFRERCFTFSLDFSVIGPRIPARQEAKLIPTVRAMRGYQYSGVLATSGGRGFLLLDLFFG